MFKERDDQYVSTPHDNYLWEESFSDETGRLRKQTPPTTEVSGSFNSAAILQDMLKNAAEDTPARVYDPKTEAEDQELPQTAPLMTMSTDDRMYASRPTSVTVQSLLQLADEAERQARLTAASAETANSLAQSLMDDMKNSGDESLRQLAVTAIKNAFLAAEAAVQAQLSAMETHAAAVNQSLADLENAKDSLHLHSQDFIQLSKSAAQSQEEADMAREKANRIRLEYAAKQNAALSSRDALAQSKREYETKLGQARYAQENLELVQKKARNAQKDYLQLKESLEERRLQWQRLQQSGNIADTQPSPSLAPTQQTMVVDPPIVFSPANAQPAETPPVFTPQAITPAADDTAADNAPPAERRKLAALVIPTPKASASADSAALEQTGDPEEEQPPKKAHLWTYGKILLVALTVALFLRVFVLNVVLVQGISMQPTLNDADRLISSKMAYWLHEPQRFDIILIDAPNEDGHQIKRVIGLPNEHILIEGGQVFIDGVLLEEDFLGDMQTGQDTNTVIPDGYYFVMGDNREGSGDSRSYGPVAKEHINGKAILRILPLNSMTIL